MDHGYPREEIDAMETFYGGKSCVISHLVESVEWMHVMDAALPPSNTRLVQMLNRKLREDRHPEHAAEVRENIVPVEISHHRAIDQGITKATLFLHEDVLARTLAYEQELQRWRIAELDAGRNDPGRPMYNEVFGGMVTTQHRYHRARDAAAFVRNNGNTHIPNYQLYFSADCPGIGNPESQNHFPVIDTLLSIPFSLLHNHPCLSAIVPFTVYQKQLLSMASEIIYLWWWDPPCDMINRSHKVFAPAVNANPKPNPINHPSRIGTTFQMMLPTTTFGAVATHFSSHNHNHWQGKSAIEHPLGPIFLGMSNPGHMPWARDELLFTAGDEGLTEEGDMHVGLDVITGIISSPLTSEAWTGTDYLENVKAVQDAPAIAPSSSDITSWYQTIVKSGPEPLPVTPTPFERGILGGKSVNDILMMKGLMDPLVYLQFSDLSTLRYLPPS